MKRILVLGASTNPERYAYKAACLLTEKGYELVPVGIKEGILAGKSIITSKELQPDIDTITLYVGVKNQLDWQEFILTTRPNRLIFNPGTENLELKLLAESNGIETLEACTLVMLNIGTFD